MATLFVDRRDASLEAERGTLLIRGADGSLFRAPLAALERVILRGPAQLSTGAIGAIAASGASLMVLSGRYGTLAGTLLGRAHADATIRIGQIALLLEEELRLRIATEVVRRKLIAQARLLRAAEALRPDRRYALKRGREAVVATLARLRSAEVQDLPALIGLEGAAAAAYFEAFASLLPPALGFAGRNRRPPRDPVNAALSLAYTLATAEAEREAYLAGLDPAVGFLHAPAAGRPSLACDLVEPLRPLLDRLVWRLFAEEVLRRAHFTREGEACLLGKAGRMAFYAAWEQSFAPARRLLRRGVRPLVRWCRERGAQLLREGRTDA